MNCHRCGNPCEVLEFKDCYEVRCWRDGCGIPGSASFVSKTDTENVRRLGAGPAQEKEVDSHGL